jgi:hypothetical protein
MPTRPLSGASAHPSDAEPLTYAGDPAYRPETAVAGREAPMKHLRSVVAPEPSRSDGFLGGIRCVRFFVCVPPLSPRSR